MQNAALAELGLGEQWRYEAIDVEPSELAGFVARPRRRGLRRGQRHGPAQGGGAELASEASDRAKAIGAANTLSFDGETIAAENTDAPGLIAALPSSAVGRAARWCSAPAGAARAAVWALAARAPRSRSGTGPRSARPSWPRSSAPARSRQTVCCPPPIST